MKAKRWVLVSIAVLGVVLFTAITTAKEAQEKMKELPELVKNAVKNLFPLATVEETEAENLSVLAFEVGVKEGAQTKSAVISSDGAVVSVESEVAAESLPDAVSKTILEKAKGGKILETEKEEIYMEVQLVKLAEPKTIYEAKVEVDGKIMEIQVDAAGNVLKMEADDGNGKKDDDDEDEDEDEDEDDKQAIALDQLPEAVKAAIVNASEGGTIKEVESEQKDGQTVYEAEVIINGQEFEIKVSADGKILEKKAEKDDDGDDDDEKEDKD